MRSFPSLLVALLALLAACAGSAPLAGGPSEPVTDAEEQAGAASPVEAQGLTWDTRILSGHTGGGALWVVRRGPDRRATRVHRLVDGADRGTIDLTDGLVVDAAGDETGLWVATGGPTAVHLAAATGHIDREVTVDDAEWIGVGDGTVVIAGPPASAEGIAVTVADASTGAVRWTALVAEVDWRQVVDVAWLDGLAWVASFALPDAPPASGHGDGRGGLAGVDANGAVVAKHDVELRSLDTIDGRLVGAAESLSVREGAAPRIHFVGPGRETLATVPVGGNDDLVWADPVVAPGPQARSHAPDTAWVPVHAGRSAGPQLVGIAPESSTSASIPIPVPEDELLEWVAVDGTDLWFVTAGPDMGPDGDLPTTLWRVPGAIR